MDLSVIIVNYNVKYFLEQCLCSVKKAIESAGIDAEVIVIDNHSSDNSIEYLRPRFQFAQFVGNHQNRGFSRACNQGALMAKGEFLLFLNPDTVVPEDCFSKCLAFFRAQTDAGALGVRMIDGGGKFLKESKRAFPSPLTSFFKLSGLASLFRRSKTFSRYHLGHLDERETHIVDVLAGAFLITKRDLFIQIGMFDETFFMYGEDIDLSYRVQHAGYKNYYYSGITILHFKGESTRKGSLNYVRMFYNAMRIFVRKHYGASRAAFFNIFLHLAIWVRAAYSFFARFVQWIGLPVLDAALIFLSFWAMQLVWSNYVKTDIVYETRLLWIASVFFTVIYIIAAYYAGLYDRLYKRWNVFRSTLIATVVLLAVYSLVPEHYRFSRGIIFFGAFVAFLLLSCLRWLFVRWKVLKYDYENMHQPHILVAGSQKEYDSVMQMLEGSAMRSHILGRVSVNDSDKNAVITLEQLPAATSTLPFDELIFCEGELKFGEIIKQLEEIPGGTRVKIHSSFSKSIVGSDSKDKAGESFSLEASYNLADPYRRRMKRLFDVMSAIFFLVTFPLQLFLVRKPARFFENCFLVLFGKKTWVGYHLPAERVLPPIRESVITCGGVTIDTIASSNIESYAMLDRWYAKEYEPSIDLKILANSYRLT